MTNLPLKFAILRTRIPAYRVAQNLGLRPDSLSKVVAGIERPSQAMKEKLATYLGVPITDLFADDEEGVGEGKRHE